MKCSAVNPNPNKPVMALHFIRALHRIRRCSAMSHSLRRRSRSIKRAAYASMARAAGSKRAWSRAVVAMLSGYRNVKFAGGRGREASQAEVLQRLLPGGKDMDMCTLLEETASYVQCLTAQVRLMQGLMDSNSSLKNCKA